MFNTFVDPNKDVPIIMEFLEDRKMSVRYNQAWSKWHTLVGAGPQGSWLGQMSYIGASDDAASWVGRLQPQYCVIEEGLHAAYLLGG